MGRGDRASGKECRGCIYAGRAGRRTICVYILKTGHRRPCPPGAGCTVRRTEEDTMQKAKWDTERAQALIAEGGRSDLEIAEAVGCNVKTLQSWKYRNGLTKAKREGALPAAPEPRPEGSAGGDGPVPVGLSFCLCGCEVTVEAPSLDRATAVLERLSRCLEEGGT